MYTLTLSYNLITSPRVTRVTRFVTRNSKMHTGKCDKINIVETGHLPTVRLNTGFPVFVTRLSHKLNQG